MAGDQLGVTLVADADELGRRPFDHARKTIATRPQNTSSMGRLLVCYFQARELSIPEFRPRNWVYHISG